VIHVERSSTMSGLRSPVPGSARSGLLRSILLTVVGITTAAVVAGRPASAGADQVDALRAEATQISQQLVREQLQVGGYEQQYQAASAAVDRDTQAIARARAGIDQDLRRIAGDRQRLRGQVVTAYISAGTTATSGFASIFDARQDTELARRQYEQVAVGDVATTIAALQTDERALARSEAMLAHRQADDRALLAEQSVLLGRSQASRSLIASQQAQVVGQLAVAVEQRQAAQRAAAAAAIRAATTAAPAAPAGGGATSDPVLNPFLQCVVQHESGGDYTAVSPDGLYMGAFQFSQSTWNEAAQLAGLPGLIGVPPNLASKADQDTLAVALYALDGQQPWYDPCRTAG
jgi:hypothetical protein